MPGLSSTGLTNHPFFLHIHEKHAEIIKKLHTEELIEGKSVFDQARTSDLLDADEKFSFEIFHLLKEAHYKIDKIQQCYFMLNFYPLNKALMLSFTEGEYIEQIMDLYFMHSIGLIDRILVVVNVLYGLDLNERSLTPRTVLSRVNDQKIFKPLLDFIITFEPIRGSRNTIVHSQGFADPVLQDIVTEDIFKRNEFREHPLDKGYPRQQLHKKYLKVVKGLKKTMEFNDKVLTEQYIALFNEFAHQYKRKMRELQQGQPKIKNAE